MIESRESKAAPEGANHDMIGPAVGFPGEEMRLTESPPRQRAEIIRAHNLSPSHRNGVGLLRRFWVAAINRAVVSYPEE